MDTSALLQCPKPLKLSQPCQTNVNYVANNEKRSTAKFHSISDYREGVVSSNNQHNCTDTVGWPSGGSYPPHCKNVVTAKMYDKLHCGGATNTIIRVISTVHCHLTHH